MSERPEPTYKSLTEKVGFHVLRLISDKLFLMGDILDAATQKEVEDLCVEVGRAAITAMRAPTGEVHRAGHSPLVPYFVEEADAYGHSQRVWEAMIDAALKEAP